MYDGSSQPFEENVEQTKNMWNLPDPSALPWRESWEIWAKRNTVYKNARDNDDLGKVYTDPEEARVFVEQTGVAALACSFGTTHGFYLSEPDLRMEIISPGS